MNNICKKIVSVTLCMCCVLQFSVNSAVLSDNDGSAFITKSEFDSLKNSFQSQLDNYNTAIDSKIDQAIASYIAGIKTETTSELLNIFDTLGGNNIKFGYPGFAATVEPKTGYAYYFINCWRAGFFAIYGGAKYNAMKQPSSSLWTSANDGKGTMGKYFVYRLTNGVRYLQKYQVGMLQAKYIGMWYRVHELVNSYQEYPFGTGPTNLGESCTLGTMNFVDSAVAYYSVYTTTDYDFKNYSFTHRFNTSNNKVGIEEKEYNKPSDSRTEGNAYIDGTGLSTTDPSVGQSAFGDRTNGYIDLRNVDVYGWDCDTGLKYEDFTPGFYENKKYSNTLWGGVHFFKTDNDEGKIKIENLQFTRYKKDPSTGAVTTTGDVYFAINSSPFANSDSVTGDVEFTKVTNAVIDTPSQNIYKASAGANITLEFNARANTIYYIKLQTEKSYVEDADLYCGIVNGAKVSITVEQ